MINYRLVKQEVLKARIFLLFFLLFFLPIKIINKRRIKFHIKLERRNSEEKLYS